MGQDFGGNIGSEPVINKEAQAEIDDIKADVKSLLALANKSKGGFWMGMTIASAVGGVVTFFVDRILK